jgi:hypothetical protein
MWEYIGDFGLILLGALISLGTTFVTERRKEQRVDKKEQQEQERELRQAGRLVYEELNNAWIVLRQTKETEVWWSTPPYDLELSAWDKYKEELAGRLDKDTWSEVTSAYTGMAYFNRHLAMSREGIEVVPSPLQEEDEGSERVLEPIQDKYATQDWLLEVLYLYEWVDGAMELLARQFLNEQSQAKLKASKRARAARRGAKNTKKS